MFIWWGIRRNDQRLGYVADFCPVCRKIQGCALNLIRLVAHFYGLNLGNGKVQGHATICQQCGLWQSTDSGLFAQIAPAFSEDIPALVRDTLPNANALYGDRLDLEKRLIADFRVLSELERNRLIREPFLTVAKHCKLAKQSATSVTSLIVVAAIVLSQLAFVLFPSNTVVANTVAATILGFGLLAAVASWFASSRIKIADRYDLLLQALLPLNPSELEIKEAITCMDRADDRTWDNVRPAEIREWLTILQKNSPQPISR